MKFRMKREINRGFEIGFKGLEAYAGNPDTKYRTN